MDLPQCAGRSKALLLVHADIWAHRTSAGSRDSQRGPSRNYSIVKSRCGWTVTVQNRCRQDVTCRAGQDPLRVEGPRAALALSFGGLATA